MTVRYWDACTRDELTGLLDGAVVVLPIGATEQHGPHLATGTDAWTVSAVASAGAERAGDGTEVVVAPTLAYGASHHHLPFGGTLSLGGETLGRLLRELLESAQRSGARRVLLLNGHGGNGAICAQVATDAARELGLLVAAADYWRLAPPPDAFAGRYPGHAGAFETAVVREIRPDGVREDRVQPSPGVIPPTPDGLVLHPPGLWQAIDGFTDDPREADADAGRDALERIAVAIGRAIDLLAATATAEPASSHRTSR